MTYPLSSSPVSGGSSSYDGMGNMDRASYDYDAGDRYDSESAPGAVGLVPVMSNSQLDDLEEQAAQAEKDAAEARQNDPVVLGLAAHVKKCWQMAVIAKQPYQRAMIRALNQRRGVYEPEILQQIQEQGGTKIFMMLTDEKCVGCEAWLEELLLPADDKSWGLKPTPVPDLPPDATAVIERAVKQRAAQDIQKQMRVAQVTGQPFDEDAALGRLALVPTELKDHLTRFAAMADVELERRVADGLAESGWREAMKVFIQHMATFPSAILKGPTARNKRAMNWKQASDGGFMPAIEETVVPEFDAVNPMDIYPAPMSKGIDDGYLIERHRLNRVDLLDLRDVEGYDREAIEAILLEGSNSRLGTWLFEGLDVARATAEGRSFEMMDPEGRIDALQFWGFVQGQDLLDWGMDSNMVPDPAREYSAEVWLIGSRVIKAVLNADPLGRKPYYMTSFRKLPGSFWGMGLVEVLQDIQDVCNSAARNLVNNMALSSGPQVGVDVGKLPEGEVLTDMFPWKIWQFDMGMEGGTRPPMWFFQPNSTTAELLKIYEQFSLEADNKSGIPRYATGNDQSGGALNTASGLSMMMGNASRGIKRVVKNVDFDVTEPSIQRQVEWTLLYRPSVLFKGDIHIQARGSTAMLQRETQQMRRTDFLRLILSSPIALNEVGKEGLDKVIGDIARGLDIGIESYIPNEADRKRGLFDKILAQASQPSGAGSGGGSAPGPGGPPAAMAGGAAPGLGAGIRGVPAPNGASTPGSPQPKMRVPDPTGAAPAGGGDMGVARGMMGG